MKTKTKNNIEVVAIYDADEYADPFDMLLIVQDTIKIARQTDKKLLVGADFVTHTNDEFGCSIVVWRAAKKPRLNSLRKVADEFVDGSCR